MTSDQMISTYFETGTLQDGTVRRMRTRLY